MSADEAPASATPATNSLPHATGARGVEPGRRPTPVDVSVVLATAGSPQRLATALDALLASDGADFEVLVVDNAPADIRTRELVEERQTHDRRVRYLVQPTPGLARARNLGFTFTRGDLVAFVDDASEVDPGWLQSIAAGFRRDPAIGCLAGPLAAARLDTPLQVALERSAEQARPRRACPIGRAADDGVDLPSLDVQRFGGVNLAVRKSLLPDLWAFDVNLGPGTPARTGDDVDVIEGFLERGQRVEFEPAMLARHPLPRDTEELQQAIGDRTRGTSARLARQLLSAQGRRREAVSDGAALLTGGIRSLGRSLRTRDRGQRTAATATLRSLPVGPWAYLRSRLHNAWMTA